MLRHDWWMSPDAAGLRAQALTGLATWSNNGLGRPALYPNNYLFYCFVWAFAQAAPIVALAAVAALFSAVCAVAASTFTEVAGSRAFAIGAMLLLCFNPWTYTELVAGHLPMLIAYAGLAWFSAEIARGRRASSLRLTLATLLVAQQIQFLLIFLVAALAAGFALRRWQPLIAALVLALPVWLGVLLGHAELARIPYTLAWERSQSLALLAALQARGYFARYATALGTFGHAADAAFAILALLAAWLARARQALLAVAVALVAALITTGVDGPIASLYGFVVTHVQATGVFRELYDLIAVVTLGYLVAIAFATRRYPVIASIAIAIGAAWLLAWWHAPPARFWVAGAQLPRVRVHAPAQSRVAFYPAFQPMSLGSKGSGVDPDVYDRPGGVSVLNTYLPEYPAVMAFSRYATSGNTRLLRALSVSRIVERPWLCTDLTTLAVQIAARSTQRRACGADAAPVALAPLPEVTLASHFAVGSLDTNVGAGNLLVGDAVRAGLASGPAPQPIAASSSAVDAHRAWVNARLFFVARPEIDQAYGGVYTASQQPLRVVASAVLAEVRGSLWSDGRRVARTTRGYRWFALGPGRHTITCRGQCAVAAGAAAIPGVPTNPPRHRAAAVRATHLLPWLWRIALPAAKPGNLLRINVTYTRYWRIVGDRDFVHVRVDGAVNGWVAQRRQGARTVYAIEARSATLQVVELVSVVLLIPIFLSIGRRRRA